VRSVVICILLALAYGAASTAQGPPLATAPKTDDTALLADFNARIARYMALHNQNSSAAPKQTSSAEQLKQQKSQMAARIRAVRANAGQGEVFTPSIAEYFRRQIAATLNGADGQRVRSSLLHAEPVKNLGLKVNDQYPESVPLQSTPPTLLLNLPKLPKELEYRFIGRALVVRDVEPNLIVDFITDALPPLQEQKQK
jgi:hypothetical protein